MKYSLWSLLLCSPAVFANPVGEAVAGGEVAFSRTNGNELHISQKSNRAIVEWEKFSIDAGEITKFLQPGPDSVLLNKVVGQEMSAIYGKLEANGQIILMNPQGVLVGKTGVIDACSFMAISQDVNPVEFMDGKFDFSRGDLKGVVNVEGRIEATQVERVGGRIFLVADDVNLTGHLQSAGGEIEVNGNVVSIEEDAFLDVSGTHDAGNVYIDSLQMTKFLGTIHAKGAEGDGGTVEVCGDYGMIFQGFIDTHAAQGKSGALILDPVDVEIVTAGAAACTDVAEFAKPGTLVQIDPATLAACGTVVIQASQDITVTSAVAMNALESITVQAGRNIIVNESISTDGGNIGLFAGPFSGAPSPVSTGSVTLGSAGVMNTGANPGGKISVQGFDINSANASPHQTNSGNISFLSDRDLLVSSTAAFLSTATGGITLYANRNITCDQDSSIGCTGVFAGLQVDIRADFDLDGVGDFSYTASAGSNSGISTLGGGNIFIGGHNATLEGENAEAFISTLSDASIEIQARNDIQIIAGDGGDTSTSVSASGEALVRAGHDIVLQGGTGDMCLSRIVGGAGATTGNAILVAGNDILMNGGDGTSFADVSITGLRSLLTAKRDILLTPGPNVQDSAKIFSFFNQTTMSAGRHIVFSRNGTGVGEIGFTGAGCDVRAGGDIVWATSFIADSSNSIYIDADATMIPLYAAQEGPYLTDSPLGSTVNAIKDGKGAFSVNTSPVGGPIALTTSGSGFISLYSAARNFNGATVDVLFDDTADNGLVIMASADGDISVGSFYNTNINNTISTTGAILIATNNNMNINTPTGFITAGGPITLIVDQETPLVAGGGFFNNFNSGVSTTDPDQRIAIYAANSPLPSVGFFFPNQVVLGNLSSAETWDIHKPLGLLSKYDTSYAKGGRFHGGGFGINYVAGNGVFSSPVIWYKIFQPLTGIIDNSLDALQQLRTLIPERLWVQEFSILMDQDAFRDQIRVLMNRRLREGTIQSHFALASSKDYFLRSTMSGENIRLMDRYQEFEQSPFWRTPDRMNTLYWLEDR